MSGQWLLYGANGYTGELIADLAIARGRPPIVAGRNREQIEAMGERLGLESRVFDLSSAQTVQKRLEDVDAVVLAAGPFINTSAPVVEACVKTATHYLDLTGELDVFLACYALDQRAREAGCTVMPGAGFDIVPTDSLAVALSEALSDATHLELAVQALSHFSQGTANTIVESMASPGLVCRDGQLMPVPIGREVKADFGHHVWPAVSLPLADIFTAHLSTGIPNVEAFGGMSPRRARQFHRVKWARGLMRSRLLKRLAKSMIQLRPRGPDARARDRGTGHVWGRARNAAGAEVTGKVKTPEAYSFTADAVLVCMAGMLAGEAPAGFQTPAMAFGSDLILRCEGCEMSVDPTS
jgi:short subunit dehydrogenase-like uncharacterized protein